MNFSTFNQTAEEFEEISALISSHLSEPYSIYVYWFFLNTWPEYCITVRLENDPKLVGVIISKVEKHRDVRLRGYIGMLVIDPVHRGKGLASKLVEMTIERMIQIDNVDEISLETEVINKGALKLYESLGFMRTKRLYRYYLNTHDAFRLILPITEKSMKRVAFLPALGT
ncbi:N-alpha-acetyltransferase 30 [[Candida] railenensis]|uniref:N-alpha-acetyltransferase 30 n=1 Tax=[Candida] railenensis TaxID=45579 RepID=A0A9P0VXU4_9ASCO|nr:N-alpha-acetyltransferase 30 [[Candida] railenensis]